MGDLTQDFSRSEFACKCGCGLDTINPAIVNRLQVIRDIIGEPILIHRGISCPAHNASVGGKPDSYHLKGDAVDWATQNSLTLERCCLNLIKDWSGGFHYYPPGQGTFCHTDIGPKRRW